MGRWTRRALVIWLGLASVMALPGHARGEAAGAQRLRAQYERMTGEGGGLLGGRMKVSSQVSDGLVSAEILGVLDHPFAQVESVLVEPSDWCDIAPLPFNVKACVRREEGGETILTLYAGKKGYQPPEDAHRLTYRYRVEERTDDYFRVSLRAKEGLMGAADDRIEVEGIPAGSRAFLRFGSSYHPRLLTRVATSLYLSTLGREKVGFTVRGRTPEGKPLYIKGVRGIVERNAVSFYLALEAFLREPQGSFTAWAASWFDLTERFPRQLHEMGREEYLAEKGRERENQLRLQRSDPVLEAPSR